MANTRRELTSWTEVSGLLQASRPGQGALAVPGVVSGAPWRSVWAVLLTSKAAGRRGRRCWW